MLVSRFTYDAAVYGGLVAIVASAWYAIRHRERRVAPKIPRAATGRSLRRYLGRIAPVLVLIALIGGEWALLSNAHDAVVLDRGTRARRAVYLGAEFENAKLGDGSTLVINRSEQAAKFFRIDYDEFQMLHEIPAGTVTAEPGIDFLGPDQHPPSNPRAEDRTWLTWY